MVASPISAPAILLLALALATPPFAATARPPSNHHRTPSSAATDCSSNDSDNKPNTNAGWISRASGWTPISCACRPPGFAVANAANAWSGRQALGAGRRGRVSSSRVARSRWDTTVLGERWRRGWGVNGRQGPPERRSSVAVGAGTGETEFYSWTETDTDLEVRVTLPHGTPSKNVQLSVTKRSIALGLKGREGPVLKGTLKGQVKADLSHWTMEKKEDTGEKVLYLCLEKEIDIEMLEQSGMSTNWVGVLEGEEAVKVHYPEKDKDFDVDEYVKRMGYDRERDIDKVDKTMFSDLTEEMRQNLARNLPKSSYTEKDDMIPVVSDPKVSPIIDTGVLGLEASPLIFEPEPGNARNDAAAAAAAAAASSTDDHNDGGAAAVVPADESPEVHPTMTSTSAGATQSPKSDETSRSPRVLTERQREISAGLGIIYDKLLKSGILQKNPDGTPMEMPDMDELAKDYDENGFMPKEGDFSEADLSKHAASMMCEDLDGGHAAADFDVNDPAVRAAFDLD